MNIKDSMVSWFNFMQLSVTIQVIYINQNIILQSTQYLLNI